MRGGYFPWIWGSGAAKLLAPRVDTPDTPTVRAKNSATVIDGTLATIVWTSEDEDSVAGFAAGVFTVPAGWDGRYRITAALAISGTFILNNTLVAEIQKNSVATKNITKYAGGAVTSLDVEIADTLRLVATDTLRVQASSSGTTPAIISSTTRNVITIEWIGE